MSSGMQGLPGNIAKAASNFVSGDYKAVSTSPKECSAKAQRFSMGYFPNPVRSSEGFERSNNKHLNALQLGGLLTVGLPVLAGFALGAAMINGYYAAKHVVNEKQSTALEKKKTSLEQQVEKNNQEIKELEGKIPGLTNETAIQQQNSELRKQSGASPSYKAGLDTNLLGADKKTQLNEVNKHIEIIKNANSELQKQIDSIEKRLNAKEQSSRYTVVHSEPSPIYYQTSSTKEAPSPAVSNSIHTEKEVKPDSDVRKKYTELGFQLRDMERRLRNDPTNPNLIAEHAKIRSDYDKARMERNQNLSPMGLSNLGFTKLGVMLRDIERRLRNDPTNPTLIAEHAKIRSDYDKVRMERNRNLFQQ